MAVTAFQDYLLADRDREWDGSAAEQRIRAWAGAGDEPNEKYRNAHVWYDSASKGNFTSYKMLIADVVDGKVVAVPRGIMAAPTSCRAAGAALTCPPRTSAGCGAIWPGTTPRWARTPPGTGTERSAPREAGLRPGPPGLRAARGRMALGWAVTRGRRVTLPPVSGNTARSS